MMQQYFEVKNQYQEYLLFYRIGDFYEMFFDDAITGSKILELTLTGRDWGEKERAPMCGVPFHAVDVYIGKLVSKGYKVAICEQTEDPSLAAGLVRREVTRIVTPGTIVETSLLNETKNNYLAAIFVEPSDIGISFADISTGQVFATVFSDSNRFDRLNAELATYSPSEVLLSCGVSELPDGGKLICDRIGASLMQNQQQRFRLSSCEERVSTQFPNSFDREKVHPAAVSAIGALLDYISETQKIDLSYINELSVYSESQYMEMDVNTRRNLELCETLRTKEKRGTLLWVLDKTRTSMGARLLRKWVELPLVNSYYINRRLDAVGELSGDFMLREETAAQLKGVLDLERLITKLAYGSAIGKDLIAIRDTLRIIPGVLNLINEVKSDELSAIRQELDPLDDIEALISASIVDDPPFSVREGGLIREGYSDEVDYLNQVMKNSKGIMSELEEREKEATGIKNLKIGYNRVFGYYIEVTRSQLELVPDRYIRKQTLAGAERYITDELKSTEATILGAADKLSSLEYELFRDICAKVQSQTERIKTSASNLAKLDVYISLAEVACTNNYVRPEVDPGSSIEIKDGRHPVVEKFVSDNYFVPNDTKLDTETNKLMLITGPNMAGKSTYMRQVALITLMAQIGSFVPAREAHIGICDKIFTRVGASDDLASGQSTFMLEMNEVAYILKNATKRSLIIYDEIGRGTSTYDGMAIAKAIAEYTAGPSISAKTLFATHYHELIELENTVKGVVNYNIAAKKRGDDITFLRKIVRGGADDSYGIEVAKLAGVPGDVIKRAKSILGDLINGDGAKQHTPSPRKSEEPTDELSFENVINSQLAEKVRSIDLDTLSPIEALNELYKLKKLIG